VYDILPCCIETDDHIASCAAKLVRRLEERCLKLLGNSKELGCLMTNWNQALMSQND
jgi:hypothetical protein